MNIPIKSVISKYQERLNDKCKFVSSNRPILGKDGVAKRFFIFALCTEKNLFLDFLKESRLLKSNLNCEKCGGKMKLYPRKKLSDSFIWVCRNRIDKEGKRKVCDTRKSMRYGSWFKSSKLTLEEAFLLTYEMIKGATASDLNHEYSFSSATLADWRQFINEQILIFIESHSEKIGGMGKDIDIHKSKLGKTKFCKNHVLENQWVCGGIERGTGKMFLVAIQDSTNESLMKVIIEWVRPGSSIYSDCLENYDLENFKVVMDNQLIVDHSEIADDALTRCHTNTVESMSWHVKKTLPHNHETDLSFYLGFYLFNKYCKEKNVDPFNTFLEMARDNNSEGLKNSI